MAKKKVYKLILEPENDFKLIGIASHENDYRLSWALNKCFGFELAKVNDFHINHPKLKIDVNYSMYEFYDDNSELAYHLISNKSEKGFLLPEIKNIDFIMRISGHPDQDTINDIISEIKKIDIIITAFLIDTLPEKMVKIFSF